MNTDTYQAALEAIRDTLITDLEDIAVHRADTDTWEVRTDHADTDDADDNAQADASEDAAERQAIAADLETRYHNVQRALQKITDGTYGICELSGEPIEPERLAANPAARTCIAHRDAEAQLAR